MYIDIYLQQFDEHLKKTETEDLKYINSIKNLKNHKYASYNIIAEANLDSQVEKLLIEELNDLENGIDMITANIEARKGLTINESMTQVESIELIKGIKNSHSAISKNGKNSLQVETEDSFPAQIHMQKLNIKRIIHSLMSLSLKKLQHGILNVKFKSITRNDMNN